MLIHALFAVILQGTPAGDAPVSAVQDPAPAPAPVNVPAPTKPVLPRAARVKAEGGTVRNIFSHQGKAVAGLDAGDLVIVHAVRGGNWLEVEVPGGLAVWMHGRYLDMDETGRFATVNGTRVNMRAVPTAKNNMPLGQAEKGARMAVVETKGDWTRVAASESLHGYVQRSSVDLLDGLGEFMADLDKQRLTNLGRFESLRQAARHEAEMAARVAEAVGDMTQAREMMKRARSGDAAARREAAALYGKAREKTAKDTAALGAAVTDAGWLADMETDLAWIASADMADAGRVRLAEAATRLAEARRKGAEEAALEAARRRSDAEKRAGGNDPLGSKFDAMGWLHRERGLGRSTIYTLQRGGRVLMKLECPSGRYNLRSFVGKEIGVTGTYRPMPAAGADRVMDVGRLVVVSS